MFQAVLEKIQQYDTIIIHRHKRPDGDALGSQIGLRALLRENFPQKKVYAVGDDAGIYSFMESSQMDTVEDGLYKDALAVVLDCGSATLVSDERYALAKDTVRFDHHIFAEKFCHTEIVDTSYESCCGLIAHFAMESGLRLTPLAAKSLYTGMVTDSGRFRYDSAGARTHTLAAFLRSVPFDTNALFRDLYADSYENKARKAEFLLRVQFTEKNTAYIYTTREQLASLQMDTFTASRGMVNTMADIRGVDIWVNFTETEQGILCEIRSADQNINPIAVKYGGGGHAKASGCTLPDRETAMALLRDLDALKGETR
ncbi:MAG: bifunctional oligoribonuclease/PAP phosphatase NrnA [Oscillospiraceae bacterium]|nr:bifunctional oligoribonuclease/PAP phosphatase NrnA [Oscillospiraceae bacterium]